MSATELFSSNRPATVVSSGGTGAPSPGTQETWTVTSSAGFPAAATGVSQFHVVDPAAATEVIAVTNVSGTTWTVTRGVESTTPVAHSAGFTVDQVVTSGFLSSVLTSVSLDTTATDIRPLGVQAAGATGKPPDAGHVHPYQPWQFLPESYGAVGDGKVIGDAVLASNTTLTSASAGFTSADTGKHIMINGGQGITSLPLITTITFVNSTTVTLGSAAGVSGTGFAAVYGTDDTSAFTSMASAMGTYALANDYFAQALLTKIYILASGPTQTGNGSTTPTFNTQIPLPYPAVNGTSRALVLEFLGPVDVSQAMFWQSAVPNLRGACLVSMVVAAATQPDPTYGWQSVIGGPTGGAGFSSEFANVKPVMRNVMVICPVLSRQYAYDFRYCAGAAMYGSSSFAFASPAGNQPRLGDLPALGFFQSRGSCGLAMPVIGNNDYCYIDSFCTEGFETGVRADDHLTAQRLVCVYTDLGLFLSASDGISGNSNRVTIANYSCEQSNGAIAGGGGFMPVDINLTAEGISTYDAKDNGSLYGVIRWSNTAGGVPNVVGLAAVKVINDNLGPGYWSGAPAAPPSGTVQTNSAWRDATIYVMSAGSAITTATVDGSTVFSGSIATSYPLPVFVPGGHTYSVTAAGGTLSTKWVLA